MATVASVIASEAKQSISPRRKTDCFVAEPVIGRAIRWLLRNHGTNCDKFNTTAAPGVASAKLGRTSSDLQKPCQALKTKIFHFPFL
jgi:hypothetical protein